MTRSLLDGADLSLFRSLGAEGSATALAGALVDSGLLQLDTDDPYWSDRDRLAACGAGVTGALVRRLELAGAQPELVVTPAAFGGDALAVAYGAAMASRIDGGTWRSWCVLDAQACDDGRVWEVAQAASQAETDVLGVLVSGIAAPELWRACGWGVHLAPPDDPAWLLGALDHMVTRAPAVVMVTDE